MSGGPEYNHITICNVCTNAISVFFDNVFSWLDLKNKCAFWLSLAATVIIIQHEAMYIANSTYKTFTDELATSHSVHFWSRSHSVASLNQTRALCSQCLDVLRVTSAGPLSSAQVLPAQRPVMADLALSNEGISVILYKVQSRLTLLHRWAPVNRGLQMLRKKTKQGKG